MCDRADPNRTEGTAALVNKVKGKKEGREEGEGGWLAGCNARMVFAPILRVDRP